MPPTPSSFDADVLIVGAGPAGLALAIELADAGLRPTVLDAQPHGQILHPAADGRDIALTHRAQAILERLGLWQRLPAEEVAPLREAVVYDGRDPRPLRFQPAQGAERLGHLVANHVIRRVSAEAAQGRREINLRPGWRVVGLELGADAAAVTVRDADGHEARLAAPLVVAADSRFSELRRRAGIGAQMRDFGRSVTVGRMAHERPHGATAQECFHPNHTVAVLPMNGNESSIVVTQPADQAARMAGWNDDAYAAWVTEQLDARLGAMRPVGARTLYPLVAVYANRFVAPRFALVGDAAVGMHPVTAHGYNFGLYGVERLAAALAAARRDGRDLGALDVLEPYERGHRFETFAIYHGTNAVVTLFTDGRRWVAPLRRAVLRSADAFPPLKRAITRRLTERALPGWLPLPPGWPRPPVPGWRD